MRSTGGPCDHCGTRQTPCWRKGPPESPTLCNACGARWIVKKSLVGYLPGTSGAHSPKAPMLCTAKQPRGVKRKPRSGSSRVLQEQRSSQQRRGSGKRSQELSPAAQATFAQLKILTQLERSVVRLASVQPPLFQPPPGQQLQPAASLQVLLQRSGSPHAGLGGPAPQLTLLPGINIQVKTLMPAAELSYMDASMSRRRRQRKCGSPSRAAT